MVTAPNENSVNNDVEKLDKYLHEAHRVSKERVKTVINSNTHKMNNVNKKFNVFQESLREGNDDHIAQNLENYTVARRQLYKSILTSESKRWNNILINNDPKKLWRSIDWDGSLTNIGPVTHPSINCMKDH